MKTHNNSRTTRNNKQAIECYAYPKPTRHRATLSLSKEVALFDMHLSSCDACHHKVPNSTDDTMQCKRTSLKTVHAVGSTGVCRKGAMNSLEIIFYSLKSQKQKYEVTLPKSWSSRIYLGVLARSIEEHGVIMLHSILFQGERIHSINDVNCYFEVAAQKMEANLMIHHPSAYVKVCGGSWI